MKRQGKRLRAPEIDILRGSAVLNYTTTPDAFGFKTDMSIVSPLPS